MPACSKRLELPDFMTGMGPVVLLGCGRLGSAMVEGWLASGTLDPAQLTIVTRSQGPALTAFAAQGVQTQPSRLPDQPVTLVLATKPAQWREAAASLVDRLPNTPLAVVSVMAGVQSHDIAQALSAPVARVMPSTAVAERQGVAAIWSDDPLALKRATELFAAMADVVQLDAEAQLDAATAVAGSAPAFIYAFVQALADAGIAQGLAADASTRLARGALRSAASGAAGSSSLNDLMARIASPGGTTRAGLQALTEGELEQRVQSAVDAAITRARELSQS